MLIYSSVSGTWRPTRTPPSGGDEVAVNFPEEIEGAVSNLAAQSPRGGAQPGPIPQQVSSIVQAAKDWGMASLFTSLEARLISIATAFGCDTKIAWLPATSTTVEPARLDM
jgi:hypothetical protein